VRPPAFVPLSLPFTITEGSGNLVLLDRARHLCATTRPVQAV
jgi:hypothetical protein